MPIPGAPTAVCTRCAEDLWRPVTGVQLPDLLTEPLVTLSLAQLQRFRDSFEELGRFAQDVTEVPWEFLTTWDMEKWRIQHGLPCRDPLFRYWQLGGR
jgi:hypothetical protein